METGTEMGMESGNGNNQQKMPDEKVIIPL